MSGTAPVVSGWGTRVLRVILLRHGQSAFNAGGRMQGQLDPELTDLGRAQARRAATILGRQPIDAIISSDLVRAFETASIVGDVVGVPVRPDERLRETHLGTWQGKTLAEVDAETPGARARWHADPATAPPGGETRLDAALRAAGVVDDVLAGITGPAAHPDPQTVVLVAHGGILAALTCELLRLPTGNWPSFGGLANASWVQLTASYGFPGEATAPEPLVRQALSWRLEVWNASAELAGEAL